MTITHRTPSIDELRNPAIDHVLEVLVDGEWVPWFTSRDSFDAYRVPINWGCPHLWGPPGHEVYRLDPVEAWELEIEPFLDPAVDREMKLEEWTSTRGSSQLPDADDVITWILETFADSGYSSDDDGRTEERVAKDPKVVRAAEALVGAVATSFDYLWCDTLVATHEITVVWSDGDDPQAEPFMDGQPLYRSPKENPDA